jgi:hypothetical protein
MAASRCQHGFAGRMRNICKSESGPTFGTPNEKAPPKRGQRLSERSVLDRLAATRKRKASETQTNQG